MPLVAPPIEAEEQPFRILIPDTEGKPEHDARLPHSRNLTQKKPKPHSPPGNLQEAAQDRPRLIVNPAWPLGKAISILESINKHPGHDDQSVHDPRSSAAQAGKRVPVSKKLRRELLEDGAAHSCTWCGYASENPKEFDVDHKVPVKLGGRTVRANLHIACNMCNRPRGAQEHRDPSSRAPWAERSRQRRMTPEETGAAMADAMRRVRELTNAVLRKRLTKSR